MRIIFLLFVFIPLSFHAQIRFESFKEEIEGLKSDRRVARYWRQLYTVDRRNIALSVPMDSILVLNRIKAAYLVKQYGFPDPTFYGENAMMAFMSIHAHTSYSDIASNSFSQLLLGKKIPLWRKLYPNYAMENMLFWYKGGDPALDQEFALALNTMEKDDPDKIDIEQLCAMGSLFLDMLRDKKTIVIGEWVMKFNQEIIPLTLLQNGNRFYLKRGPIYFLLKRQGQNIYRFSNVLDKTTLFIFENGELVLRDMYDREMGIYPIKE